MLKKMQKRTKFIPSTHTSMIVSLLDHMISFASKTNLEMLNELHRINCPVFDPLFDKYNVEGEATGIVMFILYGYSQESPMLIATADNEREKKGILEFLNIPEYMRGPLLELTDTVILSCLEDFLNTYAGEEWKLLQWLTIERNSWQRMIVRRELVIKQTYGKGDNTVTEESFDVMGTMRATQNVERLTKSIDKLQSTIKQKYQYMNLAQRDIIASRRKAGGRSIALETSKEIIRTKTSNQ